MLSDLDRVPWSGLEHAYGKATDVPGLLRDLASPVEDARGRAVWELRGNIWHQGTVYEATAHAVPFLVEIVDARARVPSDTRAEVLHLLMDIADGSSYLDVHRPLIRDETLSADRLAHLEEDLVRELRWVADARGAVEAHLGTLLRALDEASPLLQAAGAGIAASFPAKASSHLRRIEELRDAASGPREGLFQLVATIVSGQPVTPALLQEAADTDEDVARLVAELVTEGLELPELIPLVVEALVERSLAEAYPT